jgi:hypothetical protein
MFCFSRAFAKTAVMAWHNERSTYLDVVRGSYWNNGLSAQPPPNHRLILTDVIQFDVPHLCNKNYKKSELLRIPYCLDNWLTDRGEFVSPTHRLHSTPQKHYYFYASGTHFFWRLSKSQSLVWPDGLGKHYYYYYYIIIISSSSSKIWAHGSVVGLGIMLQVWRSRVQVPVSSFFFFSVYLIRPVALWPWGSLSLW